MKGTFAKALMCLFTAATLPSVVVAEEAAQGPWSANLDVGLFTDYMFRGQNLYDGFSIQPAARISYDLGDYGSISNSVWMHLSGDPHEPPNKYTELDEVITYDVDFDGVSFAAGVLWYTYPGYSDEIASTREYSAVLSFDAPLNPVVSFFHDDKEFKAQYYEIAFSESFDGGLFDSEISITPFAAFGFVTNAEGLYENNGFVQSTIGVSLDIPVGPVAMKPTVNYTFESDSTVDDGFWGGLTLSYEM